jgi:hypothetical protein
MGLDDVTLLPFGIVSQIAADGNIAVALLCGKTVDYATIRLTS